jgi:hypothetical protein
MKNTRLILMLFILFLLKGNMTNAQVCNITPAIVAESSSLCGSGISSINGIRNTGNDAKQPVYNTNLPAMEVSVWDFATHGLSWHATFIGGSTVSCNLALPSVAYDPDVTLIESYNASLGKVTWYAMVVYEDHSSNKCILDLYYWDIPNNRFRQYTTGFPVTLRASNGNPAKYSRSINIDASNEYNFAIVWDDGGLSDVELIVGKGYSGGTATPAFCPNTNGQGVVVRSHSERMPDVSVLGTTSNNEIYVTYVNSAGSQVLVDQVLFVSVCSASYSFTTVAGTIYSGTGNNFLYPRIACPRYDGSNSGDWSVIAEHIPNGGSIVNNIYGMTMWAGGSTQSDYIYTDGTYVACPLDHYVNSRPVVSYNYNLVNSTTGIMIGWTSYFSGRRNCIGVICDYDGQPNLTCMNFADYLYVSTQAGSDESYMLSMSGRDYSLNHNPIFYTFGDLFNGNEDVLYKDVELCNGNYALRKANTRNSGNLISPNPFAESFKINSNADVNKIQICNLYGQQIISISGNLDYINNQIEKVSAQLADGIYNVTLYSGANVSGIQKVCKISK